MSTTKQRLPPLPEPLPEPLCNLPAYCRDAIAVYAESAVREALAAQPADALGASAAPTACPAPAADAASVSIAGAKEGWRARVNRRREKAEAQRQVLRLCIEDIRKRIRETPAWEKPYASAITAIEIRLAEVME